MSSALAIASLTYVLKDLLNNGLIDSDITSVSGKTVKVTALAPDRIDVSPGNTESQLNLYMYQATTNQGWQNARLPSFDSGGTRVSNPPLALNLHYMLTAYGDDELYSQILLGYGMQLLHENPVLPREAIRRSLSSSDDKVVGLPVNLQFLSRSELAEQVEQIKITPQPMSTEEMSKLWTAFSAKYRPSAGYAVSVVLIERKKPERAPLPVLRRGRPDNFTNGREGILVTPYLTQPLTSNTELQNVIYPDKQLSACPGDTVTITGINLDGTDVVVCFENRWMTKDVPVSSLSYGHLTFQLPSDKPDEWVPGFYTVSLLIKRPGKTYYEETNQILFSLAPKLTLSPDSKQTTANKDRLGLFDVTISLQCSPYVRQGQRISLLFNDQEALTEPFEKTTANIEFIFKCRS